MDINNFARKFSGALFDYIWYTEELISDAEIAEAFDHFGNAVSSIAEFVDVLGFVTHTAKTVVVLSVFTFPSFDKTVEDYFERKTINRLNVSKFLARHCLQHHAETNDIFEVILNTFTFIYRVVVFCLKKIGSEEFVLLPAICWTKIFKADLKVDFQARGGWGEFKTYVAENRYTLKYGDTAQRTIAAFQAEIDFLFPAMSPEWNDPQSNDHQSDKTVDNLKEFLVVEPQTSGEAAAFSSSTVSSNIPGFNEEDEACVEKMDKQLTNGEAAECSFDTVSSNIPDFNGEGEASLEGVDKLQTNGEAAEFSIGTVYSNIPGFNEESEAYVEKVDKLQTNGEAEQFLIGTVASNTPGFNEGGETFVEKLQTNGEGVEFSFGTVDQIISTIPGFNEKNEAVVFQFDNANTNKVKISKKKAKRNRRGKSSLNPVIDTTAIEELSQACLSMQISEVDRCSIECNSTSKAGIKTVETSTAIQEDSKGEIIETNSGKEVSDSDSKATSHEGISNLGKYVLCTKTPELQSSRQDGMLAKGDQSSCQDLISCQATKIPIAVNPNCLFDKLYVNGEIFDKYVIFPVNDAGKDCSGENKPDDERGDKSLV